MTTLPQPEQTTTIKQLRRQWGLVGAVWLLVWLLTYWQLQPIWPHSTRWLLLSALALAYSLWVSWRGLPQNRPAADAPLRRTLGIGNHLSLVRGLLISLMAGFLFSPWPMRGLGWFIVLLYTIADIADHFDGYLARITNHTTELGATLDMEFDGLGMVIVTLLAVSFGQLPAWYLLLGFARYFFVFGLWLREKWGWPIHEMHDSVHRRVFAGFQMGFMSAILWPIMPPPMAYLAGVLFALPTSFGFLRDWFVVIGWFKPTHPAYRRVQHFLYQAWGQWLPLLWRLVLPITMLLIYANQSSILAPPNWIELFMSWHLPFTTALAFIISLLAIICTCLLFLGILPRLAAFLLVFPIGFEIATMGLTPITGAALTAVLLILILGPGKFALRPAEEYFIMNRLGGH
ncbi:MAG: CDP-alcohol phosphatidyltransferase family protein [Chloroflexota bacterium]